MTEKWRVIQSNAGEKEFAIGPFEKREMAEKWKRQAILPNTTTLLEILSAETVEALLA